MIRLGHVATKLWQTAASGLDQFDCAVIRELQKLQGDSVVFKTICDDTGEPVHELCEVTVCDKSVAINRQRQAGGSQTCWFHSIMYCACRDAATREEDGI